MPYSLASNFLGSSCAFYSTPLILFVNNYGPLFIHFLSLSLVILLFCNKIAFMIGFFFAVKYILNCFCFCLKKYRIESYLCVFFYDPRKGEIEVPLYLVILNILLHKKLY